MHTPCKRNHCVFFPLTLVRIRRVNDSAVRNLINDDGNATCLAREVIGQNKIFVFVVDRIKRLVIAVARHYCPENMWKLSSRSQNRVNNNLSTHFHVHRNIRVSNFVGNHHGNLVCPYCAYNNQSTKNLILFSALEGYIASLISIVFFSLIQRPTIGANRFCCIKPLL